MKKTVVIIPFFLFCFFSYLNNNISNVSKQNKSNLSLDSLLTRNDTTQSVKKKYIYPKYKINAELNTNTKELIVKQNITWINNSDFTVNKIYLKLDLNALKNNLSEFATKYHLEKEQKTFYNNLLLTINNNKKNIYYVNNYTDAKNDSTVGYVILDTPVNPSDTIFLNFSFNIKVPEPSFGIGYVKNRNFYFFDNWYIKIAPFIDGNWFAYPTPSFINYFDEFAKFEVSLKVPKNFNVGASALAKDSSLTNDSKIIFFEKNLIKSFAWFCGTNLINKHFYFTKKNKNVLVSIYVQPEKIDRIHRYKNAIFNTLEYLFDIIDIYPSNTFTLVDLPRTYPNISNAFTNLAVIKTNYFSPENLLEIEKDIINFTCKQYFESAISPNSIIEPYLSAGLSKYYESKILEKYYRAPSYYFNLASYIPINGLNFVSYNEIPIIYTLGYFNYKPYQYNLPIYYQNHSTGSISNSVYEFPTYESYYAIINVKTELAFLTIEKLIKQDNFNTAVKNFYIQNKFKHANSKSLKNQLVRYNRSLNEIFENVFNKTSYFDYKINYIKKVNNNKYEVYAERVGDGIFYNKIALFTNKDTLYSYWNNDSKWKIFIFNTKNQVIGAEIDPDKINFLDINYANNSYLIDPNYLFPISLTARWFFWIQNALMILGSIV